MSEQNPDYDEVQQIIWDHMQKFIRIVEEDVNRRTGLPIYPIVEEKEKAAK